MGTSQRSRGTGPPAEAGTNRMNNVAASPTPTALRTPSVTHSPIADRDSCQAGSRTGAGGADIDVILSAGGPVARRGATLPSVVAAKSRPAVLPVGGQERPARAGP